MDKVTDIAFFICVYNIFSFGFIKVFDSKGIINTLKKVYALTLQLSVLLYDK